MRVLFAAPALLLLAACMQSPGGQPETATAATSGKPKPVCIWIRDINGFTAAGTKSVVVSTGPATSYRLDLMGPCMDLPWVEAIGFDGLNGQLCTGANPALLVKRDKCPIIAITPLPKDPPKAPTAATPPTKG